MSGGDAMLSCHLCGYSATSPVYLAQHQKRHGVEYEGPWRTCDHCNFATRSVQDFRAHSKQHPRELPRDFRCRDCGRTYQTLKNFEKHCIQVHNKELSMMEEGRHVEGSSGNESTGNTFQCSECEFTCKSHGSMWYHQKKVHPTEEDKQKEWHCCQLCGLTFVYKQRYYAHMEQYHALSMDEPVDGEEMPVDDGSPSHEGGQSPSPEKHDLTPGQLIIKSEALSDGEPEGDLEPEEGTWVDHDDENIMLSHGEMGSGSRPSSEGDVDIENRGSANGNDESPPSLRQMLERGPSPGRLGGGDGSYEVRPGGVGFPCDDCDFVGASSSGLWYHRRKVHEPNKMATCPHCDYTAVSSRDVQKHLRKHTNERPFDCKYCERNFIQKNHLFNHIITIHKGEKLPTEVSESSGSNARVSPSQSPSQESNRPFTCNQCGRAFARKNLLQLHKMTHGVVQDQKEEDVTVDEQDLEESAAEGMEHDSDVAGPSGIQKQVKLVAEQCQCTICQKSGPNMVGYNYLKEGTAPSGKKRFECSLCRKIFSALCKCLGHIKLLHANASGNPYKCRNCGKCFLAVTSLCGHMRAHRERKKFSFQCGICEKVFQIGEALKRHVVAFHSKAISKEALAAAAKQSNRLKLKIRLPKLADKLLADKLAGGRGKGQQEGLQEDKTTGQSMAAKKRALPKTMTCNKCGQSFTQGNSYVRHMCKHLNIVPFDCKKCGKLFSSQAVLKAHMQHHNNAQMYQCIRCPFRAKYLTQLYTHMEKHFGKGVHGCVYCTTRFTKKSNIKKHILTKHRGKRLAFEDYTATVQADDEDIVNEEGDSQEDVPNEPDVMDTTPPPHPVNVYPAPAAASPNRPTPSKQPVVGNMRVEISQPDSSQIAEDRPPSTLSSEGSVHTSVSASHNPSKTPTHQAKEGKGQTMPSPASKKEMASDQKCADCLSKTSSNLKCTHCGIIFLDMVMHTIHMGWHGRNDPFECHTCGRNCGDKYGFITHIFREPHN
ncbi:zinc finger protein 594-like [Patiria miniata]|uniref:C2H2-type domain-containing protein n=1 Tax=Patiria miniata TaxID=46514 RepID=A0A914BSM7_PATMI|nr:zinc finger protein 594-like [Patiria miniata]XP_038078976.1 zinc finger protein 594-like [Patiria miniata]